MTSYKRLLHKNAVITGASNGIGRAIALAFAKEGANVVGTYKNDSSAADSLIEEVKDLGIKMKFEQLNLSKFEDQGSFFERCLHYLENIDILVNNVGVITRTKFIDINFDEFDEIISVNLKAPFFLLQKFSNHMIFKGIKGSIINISSLSAQKATSRVAHYQCSKAALSMLGKSAGYELAEFGIRVNTIVPGLTATKGNQDQWLNNVDIWDERSKDIPLNRSGTPLDHIGAAIFLASDESSWITGSEIIIDGGHHLI